jgi:pectate lyase
MKHLLLAAVFIATATLCARAAILVNDTWLDGTRTDPASPVYSENGTDTDADGDLESVWYRGGSSGTLDPVGTGGPLRGSGFGAGSASWTTYFTPESSPVTLTGAGDQLKVTWVFTPTGVNASNTSQNFRMAVVDTPSDSRLTSDGSPGTAIYPGYGMFMNFGQLFNHSHPFQLMTRTNTSTALLSGSGAWKGVADGATRGNRGYDSGTQYTFVMTVTRNATNGLAVVATMTGGNINNSGVASNSYTDAPNNGSYSFDTFSLRPSDTNTTAEIFDTSLFKVEFIPGATAPSIGNAPQDQTALVGQDAIFNVLASGTAPLSYRWYYNTNSLLTNAINSTLTLTNVQLSDSGGYSVVVSNSYGSVTSAVAQLTVSVPVAPSITTQPQDQTNILPGATATFSVIASGSEPLNYQWYYNTSTLLTNATDATLTITNVQVANAGSYSVAVNNLAGSVASSNAVLSVNTNPAAPVFVTQPASQVVSVGSTASFTAVAAGTAPISYQWNRNGTTIPGATSSTLTLTNAQTTNDGSYTVTASNSVGSVTSDAAILTVITALPVVNTAFNLVGFGQATTGGGVIPETDPAYAKVYTALDLATAIRSANKTAGSIKVIEIMTNLDLGWNEVGSAVQTLDSNPFRSHNTPKLHPRLLTTGVSLIDIKSKSGLTIFSANGATIRHANFNIKSTANIIVRNLKFDELWEWDEASKGNYDGNDWDFITIGNGGGVVSNVWIDHCTFTKAYDGICDIKGGAHHITFSWNKYTGDDGATNTNSFVWQQINWLEAALASGTNKMYTFLRTNGFSTNDIVTIIQGHDKTHLMGANDLDSENTNLTATFHHQWYINLWDRLPRLRAGNVHNYDIYVDDTVALAARRLRDTRKAAMSSSSQSTLENTYSFKPFLNGSISTESGAMLVEKSVYKDCLWPLRNNQTDPSNPAYTGKILALDTIYQMDSTVIPGNSTNSGNPLGPFQAPIIPFSWNLPGNQLPYTYNMDDPAQLQDIVASSTAGAGAGVLTWNKTNWLLTSYAPTAPVAPGNSVTFIVVAGGSAPFSYRWYFNTNSPLANATNAAFALSNAQATNAGTYSVVVSNSAGSVTSQPATLTVSNTATGFTLWQSQQFTPQQLADPSISGPNATPAGDGVANLVKYALGLSPFVPATQPLVGFRVENGDGVLSYNRPATVPDVLYVVQVSTNLFDWTTNSLSQLMVGTNGSGLQTWEGHYSGPGSPDRFFRLLLEH